MKTFTSECLLMTFITTCECGASEEYQTNDDLDIGRLRYKIEQKGWKQRITKEWRWICPKCARTAAK